MKIRTQLAISIVLFGVALLIIASSMVMTNQQVDRLKTQNELVKNIELSAGELGYLSNDYLLYNETQQLDRWNSKYAEFSGDVSKLSVNTPEQQALVNTIMASQHRLKDVFDNVVSTLEDGNRTDYNSTNKAFIQVSWSRLAVQTRGIIFDASRLSQMLQDEENQVKQTNTLIILTLMGAFVAFLLIDYLLIFGRGIKSLANLQAGTKIIGSGNLDHTIKARKGDEIGELADSFNQMTARLKTVTASKTDLEREIDDRRKAENDLRMREAELIEAQRVAHMGSWYWDAKTDAVSASEETFHIMGFDPEKRFPDFKDQEGLVYPPESWQLLNPAVLMAVETGVGYELDLKARRAMDGATIWFTTRGEAVRDSDRRIVGLRGTIQDITERKQAEEAREQLLVQLRVKTSELEQVNDELEFKGEELAAQSEELECANEELRSHNEELQTVTRSLHETQDYLESLINYANAPIIVWDPGFTIIRFNRAFERLAGYTTNEVLGKHLSILFPRNSSEESLDKIKKTLEGEQWESVEISILHKFGGVRIALWNSANIYDDNKNLLATIAQGQDITQRKQAEKELEESRAQAELYLDLMGHDISNMHQIVLMQLELAADILKMEGKLESDDKELIESSIRTLDKASRLIKNVRKLQKHQSREYSLEPIDLTVTLKEVLKDYSDLPGKDVTIKYQPDGRSLVRANPLLKDVFSNLVDNAVKHTAGPLVLVVDISKVSLNGGSYFRVAIEDNGNGIPDNKKDEVFHRFKRGQTKARGTGLGLYIVKTLVEGFGGYVEVQNRVLEDYTKGTRFLVYLPVMEEEEDVGNM
jgi:PAS domain S-box-containing protein